MNFKILLTLLLFMGSLPLSGHAQNTIPKKTALRVLIGEASDQGLKGMICVAEVLRRRGSIKGFYGYNSPHVDKEPEAIWKLAEKAWEQSEHTNYTLGADHFENVNKYGEPWWAKNFIKTFEYKDHVFYKATRAKQVKK